VALDMVLNELSIQSPASDIQTAQQWMSNLLRTIRAATKKGVNRVLRTHRDFHATILAPSYLLAQWRNDRNVDREERRYFQTLITKSPFLADLDAPEIEDKLGLCEFTHGGDEAEGLGHAYLLEALAVSVSSESRWEFSLLELKIQQLGDDGNLTIDIVKIIHASQPGHIVEHDEWIRNRLRDGVANGTDLWNRRCELFPSLGFCENVSKQMQQLGNGDPMLRPVVKRLFELEDYCKSWHEGPFKPDDIPTKVTPESQATLQQFGRERTFLCPDGQERIFSWHARITPGAWRIHFYPEEVMKKIIIGYIGRHLRTVRNPA